MNGSCTTYRLPQPYPSVPAQPPDTAAARQLLADYAGTGGEMTAVSQYFYNSMITNLAGLPALSELFFCVSITEMLHLQKIGELILAYGGDPGFLYYPTPERTSWWTGANVEYAKQPALMLRNALAAEQAAIRAYRHTCTYLEAPEATALIGRIIADEEHHIVLFTAALRDHA